LAFASVELAKVLDQIAVATRNLRHQVAASLIRDAGGFLVEKPSYCVLVAGRQ
jgi:hypothetical protein